MARLIWILKLENYFFKKPYVHRPFYFLCDLTSQSLYLRTEINEEGLRDSKQIRVPKPESASKAHLLVGLPILNFSAISDI